MAKNTNKFKCTGCEIEVNAVNDVDAARTIVHKDGCSGLFDLIERVTDTPAEEAETSKKKK